MAKNENLHRAKTEKNDEFYTQTDDVAAELKHYRQHFTGKTVLCNCDDPSYSAFWEYFHVNFTAFGLKKLVSTCYNSAGPTYKTEYEGGNDGNIKAGIATPLEGNGDFRSRECTDILDGCDIVVTNPPFSLFREYIRILTEHKKKFAVIGNMNAITYKEIFPLIKNNKIWLGYTSPKEFSQPDGTIKKFGNILWFTNLDITKRHEKLDLIKAYKPEEYPAYDNYDAINIDRVADIPYDYGGAMGVPITFLDRYCPDDFEIIGATESEGRGFSMGLWDSSSKTAQPLVNGKRKYKRIFIKRL